VRGLLDDQARNDLINFAAVSLCGRPFDYGGQGCSAGRRRQLFSALGEDADRVVPIEALADPAGGGRVGGDVSMFVFDRRRILDELPWVDVVG
jgi:hypothetical protein